MATLREMGLEPRTADTQGSTLRDMGLVPRAPQEVTAFSDEASANSMGQLRRGFAAGRLGADANAMNADMSALRAAGRHAEADELSQRAAVVQQRAGVFAPAEQDVTALQWDPGRMLDYGLGVVGQGAASMLDPVTAAAGLGAAGRGLSAIPTAPTRMLGGALSLAAPAAAYALNYRQSKGEFVGDAYRDPETLRTKTPQEIENAAMFSGAVSGGLDTLFQASAAGRLVGKPGMKALAGTGVIPKTALDMAGEAGTELAQGETKRATLGYLNPDRDTSGDASARWNDVAGGFLGAGPFALGSNLAQKGYGRLGVQDDGEVGDNLTKGATGRSGASTAPSTTPSDTSVGASVGRMARERAAAPPDDGAEAWRATLMGEGADTVEGLEAATRAQHAALVKELGGRAAKGDAAAQQHLDTLNAENLDDPVALYEISARDAAREHLIGDGMDDAVVLRAYEGKYNRMSPAGQVSADDMGGGKVTGRGDDVHPAKPSAESRALDAARSGFRQQVKLVGETLAASAAPKRRAAAMNLGAELMEFGAKSRASGVGRVEMRVAQRMASALVTIYGGGRAESVLNKAAFHAGDAVENSPLFKEVRRLLTLAANPSQREQAAKVERQTAADELARAVPPLRVKAMMKQDGADLSDPQTRLDFLNTIERVFNGEGQFNEAALTREFGPKTVEAMRDIVVVQDLERRAEAEVEPLSEVEGDGGKTAAAVESDEVGEVALGEERGEEEDAAWERRGAEKNIEDAPGARDYTFFGGRGASGAEGKHPFVANEDGSLPGLMRLDSADKSTGINSLENLKSKLFEQLGGHGPAGAKVYRLVKLLEAGMAGPPQPIGDEVGNREGDADSVNKGDLAVGGTRIRTTSAKQVMDHHKVSPTERIQVMRNYLARMKGGKVVLTRDDPTIQQLQTTDRRIAKLEKATPKERVLAVGPNGALTEDNPAYAELRSLKGLREDTASALAAKIGVEYREGMTLAQMADAYFSDAHLVVAEQMAEKDQLRVTRPEFIEWARLGARYLKRTDLAGSEARAEAKAAGKNQEQTTAAGEAAINKMAADMNLLRFKSKSAVAKDGIAVIPAHELATWVYENRTGHKEKGYNSIEARATDYRAAIMEGVAALVADGFADELPYMLNEGGQRESFEQGFPPALQLGGVAQADLDIKKTQAESKAWERGLEERTRREALTPRERYQEDRRAERARKTEVAKEQNTKDDEPVRNTDADELVDEGKRAKPVDQVLTAEGEDLVGPRDPLAVTTIKDKAQFWDAPAAENFDELAQRTMGNTGEGKRTRVPLSPVAPETVDTRTDENRTPLDAERKQTSGVPTDRTDLRNRNSVMDAALDSIDALTPMNAMRKAGDVARSILGVMSQGMEVVNGKLRPLEGAVPADPRSGFQRMQRLVASLRAAQFRKTDDLRPVGGKQYAAPLAHILTPDNIAWMVSLSKNPKKAKADLELMRSETADSLTKEGGLSQADKTTLARLLTGNEKLSSMKVAETLEKLAWPARMERKRLKDKATAEAAETAAKIARKKAGPTAAVTPKTEPESVVVPKAAPSERSVRDMPMNYKDGTNGMRMRQSLAGKSTMDLIREGVRTATTGALERFRGLKLGDVFTVVDNNNVRTEVRVTSMPVRVSTLTPSEWAQPEGWMSTNYAKYKDAWQMRYELVSKAAEPVSTPNFSKMSDAELDAYSEVLDKMSDRLGANEKGVPNTTPAHTALVDAYLAELSRRTPAQEFDAKGEVARYNYVADGLAGARDELARATGSRGRDRDERVSKWQAEVNEYTGNLKQMTDLYGRKLLDAVAADRGAKRAARDAHDKRQSESPLQKIYRQEVEKVSKITSISELERMVAGKKARAKQFEGHSALSAGDRVHGAIMAEVRAAEDRIMALKGPARVSGGPATDLPAQDKGLRDTVRAAAGMAAAGRKFNAQSTPAGVQAPTMSTDAQVEEARAYVERVLGPKIVAAFAKKLSDGNGGEVLGEFIEAKNLIELSLASGPMLLSVAHHEAMHGLWSQISKSHPAAAGAMQRMADSPRIQARLNDLLAAHPDALAAIQGDTDLAREERVAYAYQFWAAGELVVDKKPATWFAKVRRALRVVFGMVRDSETALDIMTAFHDGELAEPSAAGKVISSIMAKQTWNEDVRRKFDKQIQHIHSSVDVSNEVMRKSESKTMRDLASVFFTNPGRESDGGKEKGYLNARAEVVRQYTNYLYHSAKNLSEQQMVEVAKHLQAKAALDTIASPTVRKAVADMRALTKRYYNYATQSVEDGGPGLKLEFLGEDHYPRVWDLAQLVKEKDKFVAMLMQPKYDKVLASAVNIANTNAKVPLTKDDVIAKLHEHLMEKNGVDDKGVETNHDDVILSPFFASQKERSFKWLDDADVEPFLEKDLVGTMTRYLHQGIRAAEFARRFGNGGERLRELTEVIGDSNPDGSVVVTDGPVVKELREAAKEKGVEPGKATDEWVARRMLDLKNAVAAHEGSLGHDISPAWRKTSSALMAYQNLRLLPLSLFAAFADPMSISARSDRGMAPAMDALTQGLKDVWARWKDAASDMPAERVQSVWEKMAEASGAVDSHMFLEQIGKAHTSEFMTDFARKSNRWLFMANGLTAWDRSMRVTATKYAALFIADHKDLPNKQHSARWLNELGLKPDDIVLDAEGTLVYDRHVLAALATPAGATDEQKAAALTQATAQAQKIQSAIVRFVEGSVLTPNAAQRPTWASDPRWSVLFHLKQFTYSFQDTVLKRAANEAGHGNMNPLGALAAAVPVMMVSDVLKGFVQGGGSLPAYMKAWGFGDHLMHGISRAGLGGVGQLGVEGLTNPVSLFGPTVEQAVKIVTNPGELGVNAVDAVPGLRMVGGVKDFVRV